MTTIVRTGNDELPIGKTRRQGTPNADQRIQPLARVDAAQVNRAPALAIGGGWTFGWNIDTVGNDGYRSRSPNARMSFSSISAVAWRQSARSRTAR